MARTESSMLKLGSKAPNFELLDAVSGRKISLDDLNSKRGLLVFFICNHCPFVKHIERALAQLGRDFLDTGLGIVGISANDVERFPEDSPENMKLKAQELGYTFPYLYDESQEVARAYSATCTPDFFLYNENRELVYRGQFDDSRPGNGVEVTGGDLRGAMRFLLEGRPIDKEQKPSIGCNIKWKES